MSRFSKFDLLLAVIFAAIGAAIGGWIVWESSTASFYQIFMPEIVHHACGQGWVRYDVQPKPLLDFLLLRSTSFDCGSLPAPTVAVQKNVFLQVHLYLAKLVDFVWRHSSLEYSNLWPIAGLLVGAYASGVFVLMRMFFSRWLAIAGAGVLTFSPIHLGMVIFIRDYSKAPFFIWSLAFALLAIRPPTGSWTVVWAALGGVVIGLGYGFRQDIIFMLPLGILLLAATSSATNWRTHVLAAATFGVFAFVSAAPVLSVGTSGGFGSVIMQGLSEPYRKYLALGEAPYSLGVRYSDELTLSSIAADLSAHDDQWEAKEPQPWAGMSQSILRSSKYVLQWLPLFSGDFTTQALKSALWILGLPSIVAPGRLEKDWGLPTVTRPPASEPGFYLYSLIGQKWLPWVGLAGLVVFLWQIWSARRREAFALALAFGALLSYSVVQFALRHVFHLEFLWVMAIFALLRAPFHRSRMAPSTRSFFFLAAGLAIVILGMRTALVRYQDYALRAQFGKLIGLPRERITLERKSRDETILLSATVPDRAKALVEGSADSMDNTMGSRGTQSKVLAMVDRWLITVDSAACQSKILTLSAEYEKSSHVWQPLDQNVTFDVRPGKTQIVIPAFYRATQHFSGIALPRSDEPCISTVERISGSTKLPSALNLVLRPNWQQEKLHRSLGGFPIKPQPDLLPRWY